jgi:peptidoglycan/LPS O-acetylase OafA/YrhL
MSAEQAAGQRDDYPLYTVLRIKREFSMPELTVSPKRILSLDALRGLAAILVVVHHLPIYFDISVAQDYVRAIKNLQLMVDLFFVISGFILTDVYISKINRPSDAISFCARRISRLYPLHFLSMVAVGLLALHATGQVQALISGAYSNDFRNFMLNLTLTQKVGLETSWSFNTPSWSISTEFWVNLLFAGIIVLLGKKYLGRASVTLTFFSTLVLLFLCKGWISAPKFAHLDAAVFRTMAGFLRACSSITST